MHSGTGTNASGCMKRQWSICAFGPNAGNTREKGRKLPPHSVSAKREPGKAKPKVAKREPGKAKPKVAKREPGKAKPKVAKREPGKAKPKVLLNNELENVPVDRVDSVLQFT